MKIAVGSDMPSHVVEKLIEYLENKDFLIERFGALKIGEEVTMWPAVGHQVASNVMNEDFDFGILFCWTGTGVSIAANKVHGIRAALCTDAETARGAKKWNDANILVMSLRLISEEISKEILEAWLSATFTNDEEDISCLTYLNEIDK